MSGATEPGARVPWELALVRSWRKLAVTFIAALAVASIVWQVSRRSLAYALVFTPGDITEAGARARAMLVVLSLAALGVAAVIGARVLWRARRNADAFTLHRELLVASLSPLPLLTVPAIEFEHPFFTAIAVLLLGLAVGWAASREAGPRWRVPEPSARQAVLLVAGGYVVFVAVMGFIAHWRFITFHAQTCDTSFEVGAVAGIVRHGVPTMSVAAWMYDGKTLPSVYFNNHVPLIYYLYAPFYALHRDGRTLLWLQAAFMGAGAFGAYLVGARWLGGRAWGVLAGWLYLANPSVQSFCLHDIHANILVIPCLMLAVGFMEAGHRRLAVAFAILTALCREEAPLFSACIGLYWMLGGEDRGRFRLGLAVLLGSIALQAFFALFLMRHFGGHPRWETFSFFYDASRSASSLIGGLALNPMGAAVAATSDMKLEYLVMSLVPMGALALWGWKAGWFALPALLLLVPAGDGGSFCPGMNYSAPLVPAILLMGVAGLRRWRDVGPGGSGLGSGAARVGIIAYVVTTALLGNYLYGNIAAKSYKLEYGASPLRRQNQHHYRDLLGYVDALPPYGSAEKGLWEVVRRVPRNVPIATSWTVNPQLADWDVALALDYSGGTPAPEERVKYLVIDKLPAIQSATERHLRRFRADARWKVFYENASGVIFERR